MSASAAVGSKISLTTPLPLQIITEAVQPQTTQKVTISHPLLLTRSIVGFSEPNSCITTLSKVLQRDYTVDEIRVGTYYRRLSSWTVLALNVACLALTLFTVFNRQDCDGENTSRSCKNMSYITMPYLAVVSAFEAVQTMDPLPFGRFADYDFLLNIMNVMLGWGNVMLSLGPAPEKYLLRKIGFVQISRILVPSLCFIKRMTAVDKRLRKCFSSCNEIVRRGTAKNTV